MQTGINQGGQGETIRQLARRHLRDQSHTTTDEELKNAILELTNYVYSTEESLFKSEKTEGQQNNPDFK